MKQVLYFCSPGENQYYSVLPLWGVARVSEMANGTPWLEPQWVGGHGEVPDGLALYTSRLDATISSLVLNQRDGDAWAVYPFTDFNVTQMMLERKAEQSQCWVMLIFGFTGDDFRRLIKTTGIYRTVYFPVGFPVSDSIDQNTNPAILSFAEDFFESVDSYWKVHFNDYCQDIQHLNEMSKDDIETMARKAITQGSVTDKPLLTASTHASVMTYSGGEWIVSSPDGVASSKVH